MAFAGAKLGIRRRSSFLPFRGRGNTPLRRSAPGIAEPEETSVDFFSDQEVDRLRIAFGMHVLKDNQDDGVLRTEDLKDLLKTLFIVPTASELEALTSKMDAGDTGKIDFHSFFVAIAAFMKPQYGTAMLDTAFYDITGGRDIIDTDSLQRAMIRLGQSTITREDCEAMIREVDRGGDGHISLQDFHHLQTRSFDD